MRRYKRTFRGWLNVDTNELADNRLLIDELDYRYDTEYYQKTIKVGVEPERVTICDTEYRGRLVAVDENHVSIETTFDKDDDEKERHWQLERAVLDAKWREPLSFNRRITQLVLGYVIPFRGWLSELARYKPPWERRVQYRLTADEREKIKSMVQAFASDLKVLYRKTLIPYRGAVILYVDSDRCDFEYVTVLGLYNDPEEVYEAVIYSPEYRNRHPSSAKANSCLFIDFDHYQHSSPAEIEERCRSAILYWCEQQVQP